MVVQEQYFFLYNLDDDNDKKVINLKTYTELELNKNDKFLYLNLEPNINEYYILKKNNNLTLLSSHKFNTNNGINIIKKFISGKFNIIEMCVKFKTDYEYIYYIY